MQRIVIGFTRILASEDLKQLPEITGVEVSYREQVKKVLNLHWNGQNLSISTQYVYRPESIRAESLAVCDSNEPVFFKYALGKGFVYLLTLPLERHLAETPNVFSKEDTAPYHEIYSELARSAGVRRLCDSDHPYVRLTEHPMDEDHACIFAINYSGKPAQVKLTLQEGFAVSESIYGPLPQNGYLALKECDGALFIIRREEVKK